MIYSKPVTEIIQSRFSCRKYLADPLEQGIRQRLQDFMATPQVGPLGSPARFSLVSAKEQDRNALKGLGTYGYIKGASGFIIGATSPQAKHLEDYGYMLERIILLATDLNLGTCWLGGTFTKSSFAKKIATAPTERIPAVASVGYIAQPEQARAEPLRQKIGADSRLPWENLFFHKEFETALTREEAGIYATPLDMVRLGPSASNQQPWRIIKDGHAWHFYLRRTEGYRERFVIKLLRLEDLQRVDMGIAMCHFELVAQELGLNGQWLIQEPPIERPDNLTEYTVSWIGFDPGS